MIIPVSISEFEDHNKSVVGQTNLFLTWLDSPLPLPTDGFSFDEAQFVTDIPLLITLV